jgi:hypothetical protein
MWTLVSARHVRRQLSVVLALRIAVDSGAASKGVVDLTPTGRSMDGR